MKRKFLLLNLISLFSFQIYAQAVPQEQRTLLTKITATWCTNCGAWGWDMFENLIEDNESKSVLIACHDSGDLVTTTGVDLVNNWSISGQPRFLANDENQGVSSGNMTSKRTEIKNLIDNNFASMPLANAGIEVTMTDSELEIKTKTKFFQPSMGEYYLGVYILENDVVNNQASRGSNAVHKKILRTGATDGAFGELLMNGMIGMNMEFDRTFNIDLNTEWNVDNLEIVTIIWRKENDKFQFVNTNITTQIGVVSSTQDFLLQGVTLNISPNIITDNASINIESDHVLQNANLQLVNIQGQKIATIFEGAINEGNASFYLENNLPKGMYFVQLSSENKVISKKILIQ